MMNKFSLMLLVFLGFLTNSNGQKQGSTITPGWHFIMSPVFGITSEDVAIKTLGRGSAKYKVWDECRKIQYRDSGTEYFLKYPNDAAFKEWFLKTVDFDNAPHYWINPEEEIAKEQEHLVTGSPVVSEYDDAAESLWKTHYLEFRYCYLSDTSLSGDSKAEFKSLELQRDIQYLAARISSSSGNLEEQFNKVYPLITEYCQQATEMATGDHPDTRPLSQLLDLGTNNKELQKTIMMILGQSKDSLTRANTIEIEKRVEINEQPAQLKLPSLNDGKIVDLQSLKGKVVLVEFWNIHCGGCIASMPEFERIFKQFHKYGFEIISVCVKGVVYGGRDSAIEHARALELLKKKGVTYLTVELDPGIDAKGETNWNNPPEWKNYFGNAYGGSLFLLDQQGRLVSTEMPGQWLEFNIRKLLKLPLDKTGKE